MKNALHIFFITLLALLMGNGVHAQQNVYDEMSIDEILNIDVVVTASKQPEDLFEAPLSVSIINKEDIRQSGATSIVEALRLSQGVIVREVTPGNFDVQIRGFDDITKNTYINLPYNTTVLVMIDNRIVYDYYSGGTLWETLSIDLNDIERIEIVRGPASALYGPNAATGVINIITSHANQKGLNASASSQLGNANARLANTNIGYNWNEKTSLSFTGNYTERNRFDDQYYDWWNSQYTSLDNMSMMMSFEKDPETHETWTYEEFSDSLGSNYEIDKSLKKLGGNLFFAHTFNEHTNMQVALGAQNSQCQKTGFLNFATPLSEYHSSNAFIDNKFKIHNLYGQWNLRQGEVLGNAANSFKYKNLDANLEYLYQYKTISLRPGISFKNSLYNSPVTYDEPFDLSELNQAFKDEARSFNSFSASLLADWQPWSNLRVIGGFRIDKFNINTHHFANYELAATYRLNKNNLFRSVVSRANRSPSFFDSFVNTKMSFYHALELESNNAPVYVPVEQNIVARSNQKYPSNNCIEISWRNKTNKKLDIDVELFYMMTSNLVVSNEYREINTTIQLNEALELDSVVSGYSTANMYIENYDINSTQLGLSFMVRYKATSKLEFRCYGTIQKTMLRGNTDFEFKEIESQITMDTVNNTVSTSSLSSVNMSILNDEITPTFYGGLIINYKLNNKLNLNINTYTYTKQIFDGTLLYNMVSDYSGIYYFYSSKIDPFAVVNAKIDYKFNEKANIFISAKNLLGEHREFGFADRIGTTVLVGLQWTY